MKTPYFILLIVLIAIALFGFKFKDNLFPVEVPQQLPEPTPATNGPSAPTTTDRMMSVEDYVRINISELSPVKEQVGGKFFVTDITTDGSSGVVSYEDGHNAYTADFTYTVDIERGITITWFEIRPQEE